MLEVLLYLFEHYMEEGREVPNDEAVLKSMLKDAGFPQAEINKAFTWLETLVAQPIDPDLCAVEQPMSFRVYSPQELACLDEHCRGFLLTLEHSGIINSLTREVIIERAIAMDLDEIDLDKFKLIIMIVLANQAGNEDLQEWIETLVFDQASEHLH